MKPITDLKILKKYFEQHNYHGAVHVHFKNSNDAFISSYQQHIFHLCALFTDDDDTDQEKKYLGKSGIYRYGNIPKISSGSDYIITSTPYITYNNAYKMYEGSIVPTTSLINAIYNTYDESIHKVDIINYVKIILIPNSAHYRKYYDPTYESKQIHCSNLYKIIRLSTPNNLSELLSVGEIEKNSVFYNLTCRSPCKDYPKELLGHIPLQKQKSIDAYEKISYASSLIIPDKK